MTATEEKKCADLVAVHCKGRIDDLRELTEKGRNGDEDAYEALNEYGLCFDYVPSCTFEFQPDGYFRFQISWGGPSDEFRFICGMDHKPSRIEYWYMDWGDGAKVELDGEDQKLMADWLDNLDDCGILQAEFDKAVNA